MKRMVTTLVALIATAATILSADNRSAAVCAGAARLNNGSLVCLGGPWGGVMTSGAGQSAALGSIHALFPGGAAHDFTRFQPALSLSASGFGLTFDSQPGLGYVLQASTNLLDWYPLLTNYSGDWTMTLSDTNAAQFQRRFYRFTTP
jgi:hypothetical protein